MDMDMDMDMEDVAVVDRTIIMVGMGLNNNIDKVNLKDFKIKTMELISNTKEMEIIIKEAVEAVIEVEEAVEDIRK